MKPTNRISKIRANRLKYLKLFPLFIEDIDRVSMSDRQCNLERHGWFVKFIDSGERRSLAMFSSKTCWWSSDHSWCWRGSKIVQICKLMITLSCDYEDVHWSSGKFWKRRIFSNNDSSINGNSFGNHSKRSSSVWKTLSTTFVAMGRG